MKFREYAIGCSGITCVTPTSVINAHAELAPKPAIIKIVITTNGLVSKNELTR